MKFLKKSFTLIELLISIVIVGVLIVLIFSTYIQLSRISIRIENEKNLNSEILFLSQSIQSYADKGNIDYANYTGLQTSFGLTGILNLSGDEGKVSIYATGNCIDDISKIHDNNCWIQMNKNGQIIDLTDKNKIYFTKFFVKIIPYDDINKLNLNFNDILHNGFGVYTQAYSKRYNPNTWHLDVMTNYQSFYNIRKY